METESVAMNKKSNGPNEIQISADEQCVNVPQNILQVEVNEHCETDVHIPSKMPLSPVLSSNKLNRYSYGRRMYSNEYKRKNLKKETELVAVNKTALPAKFVDNQQSTEKGNYLKKLLNLEFERDQFVNALSHGKLTENKPFISTKMDFHIQNKKIKTDYSENFQTASGKKILLSEDNVKKCSKIFDNILNLDDTTFAKSSIFKGMKDTKISENINKTAKLCEKEYLNKFTYLQEIPDDIKKGSILKYKSNQLHYMQELDQADISDAQLICAAEGAESVADLMTSNNGTLNDEKFNLEKSISLDQSLLQYDEAFIQNNNDMDVIQCGENKDKHNKKRKDYLAHGSSDLSIKRKKIFDRNEESKCQFLYRQHSLEKNNLHLNSKCVDDAKVRKDCYKGNVGFASASGKAINVSDLSLQKAFNHFKISYVDLKEPYDTPQTDDASTSKFKDSSRDLMKISSHSSGCSREQCINRKEISCQINTITENDLNIDINYDKKKKITNVFPETDFSCELALNKQLPMPEKKLLLETSSKLKFEDKTISDKKFLKSSNNSDSMDQLLNISDNSPSKIINGNKVRILKESGLLLTNITEDDVNNWQNNLERKYENLSKELEMLVARKKAFSLQKQLLNCPHVEHTRDESLKYVPFIKTPDDAIVIPNVENVVGLFEIDLAFKTMPGVEIGLLPKKWIENHYKWIVWKLASMERAFPTKFQKCLSLENVMLQLKYRYDREIDCAERSAIRLILEKDAAPQRRMILCVSDIIQISDHHCELELTDGWYSVKAIIDKSLYKQILLSRIKIGTKIATSGAELLNCDGCYPLEEISESVRLKIMFNSTRRALWNAKLGFQKSHGPLLVSLDCIDVNGGIIGCIKIYVVRVYPLQFMEQQEGFRTYRNERADLLRAQEWENEKMRKIEELQNKIMSEDNYAKNEIKSMCAKNLKYDKNKLAQIICPQTLHEMMENSNDPESFYHSLTSSQQSSIAHFRNELFSKHKFDLSTKLSDQINNMKLNRRNVTVILQLRIVDRNGRSKENGMILKVYNPTDEHLSMLKEEAAFTIYNLLPDASSGVRTTTKTRFKSDVPSLTPYHDISRQVTPIALVLDKSYKTNFNEFDTIGIVIKTVIENNTQYLWLADFLGRLLLITVSKGPKQIALLEKLKIGQSVTVCNLILQQPCESFGRAIASYFTVISSYPKQEYLQKGLKGFNEQLPKVLKTLLEDCQQKITIYRNLNLKDSFSKSIQYK